LIISLPVRQEGKPGGTGVTTLQAALPQSHRRYGVHSAVANGTTRRARISVPDSRCRARLHYC